MKILFILFTLVYAGLTFGNENQAVEQVRLSLWYQGVEKEVKKEASSEEVTQLNSEKIVIPEELIKALDRV